MEIKIGRFGWTQIGGDMNPSQHGATIAKGDGSALELREIQPVRSLVGDGEALETGFPFWTRDAYYTLEDLDPTREEVRQALQYMGITSWDQIKEAKPTQRALIIAEALLSYGSGVDEGPAGWAKDVVPGRVKWWGAETAQGYRYIADEDREFKQLQREARRGR